MGVFSLASGSAAPSVSSLPGGTYPLTAQYSGDGTFAPSTSAPSPSITVNSEPSTTTLSVLTLDQNFNFIPSSGGPYGSFVYLRADVAGVSGQGVPKGNVAFMDGSNNFANLLLNSQGNTATPNFANAPNGGTPTGLFTLAVGSHSITADYAGDPSFQASNSSAVNVTITQASTTTAVTSTGASQGSTLTATVNTTSGGTPPSGTVTFFVNSAQVGTPVSVTGVPALTSQTGTLQGAQASASYTDSALANGSYTVKATYNGDSNYLTSTSTGTPVSQQSDFAFSEGNNTIAIAQPGGNGTLTLTITALDGYNGTINFSSSSCSGLPVGATCGFSAASVTGSGTTILTVSTTAAATAQFTPRTRYRGWWIASTAGGLACVFLLGGCSRRRGSARLLTLVLCALLVTGMGCGGGSNSPPPPPPPPTPTPTGTSNVVVTASSGTLKHTVTFLLNVQ